MTLQEKQYQKSNYLLNSVSDSQNQLVNNVNKGDIQFQNTNIE